MQELKRADDSTKHELIKWKQKLNRSKREKYFYIQKRQETVKSQIPLFKEFQLTIL
jgi:hypothetical protein